MIFDDRRTLRTINDAPNDHIIKIFFYLAFHQPEEGIRGYTIDRKQLQYDLKLKRTNFLVSLRWLKENLVVNELKLVGYSDFMVNPCIVMNNCDQKERFDEWNRRVHLEDAKIKKNRERKRKSELKKQSQ